MFKILTSLPKVISPINRCVQGKYYPYRFVSIPKCQIQLLTLSSKSQIQYSLNLSNIRLCHAKSSELTSSEKFKKAAKEYGLVLILFHVGISLISLGSMYFFISHGVDVQQWISWLGMSNADENNKIVAGASQFIIAYAIHKSLAPVRISITLVSVPLIVKYLRAKGIMKIRK